MEKSATCQHLLPIDDAGREMNARRNDPKFFNDIQSLEFDGKSDDIFHFVAAERYLESVIKSAH